MVLAVPAIQWVAGVRASGLHAADALRRGMPLVDSNWQSGLQQPADQLKACIAQCSPDEEMIWRHLHGLCFSVLDERELAEQALRKAHGLSPAELVQQLAACLSQLDQEVRRIQPQLDQELRLRAQPMQQQWDARGPGLLRQMAMRIDENLLVPHVEIALVHPVLGGGGEAHLLYDNLRLEAMLFHPVPELPEPLRLAWLIAQLNQELPGYSEAINPLRIHDLASVALIPAALMAADYVDLAHFDESTLARALQVWHAPSLSENLPALVWDWWQTYSETRPPWKIALQALDHLCS
jgi:hypothetical protein